MSFAYDVKQELCALAADQTEQWPALAYGLLLFGRQFDARRITLRTEHVRLANLCVSVFEKLFACHPAVRVHRRQSAKSALEIVLDSPAQALAVFRFFGYEEGAVGLRLNRANLETEDDLRAFVRGAFLSCGSVVDPEKDYHLEFAAPHQNSGKDLAFLLEEQGFQPKTIWRGGRFIVYFKDSGQIEDVLTFAGASRQSLELMNVKIFKDIRNKANRVTNCETANIDKTVNAAAEQVAAIRRLVQTGGYERLPEELREASRLLLAHPDVSLRELGALMREPLSRSGVYHRMQRILTLAETQNSTQDARQDKTS